jgi:hypothetical protein
LERVLEREQREGGSSILLPVRLDDFVFGSWAPPSREDLARHVRARVIGDFSRVDSAPGQFDIEIGKVVVALAAKKAS